MRSVIVGVEPEGSEQPALRWAAAYARATEAELVLVTAWSPDQAEVDPGQFGAMEASVRAHARQELTLAGDAVGAIPYSVVVRPDAVHVALASTADEQGAELIVVGHPAGIAPRWTSSVLDLANHGDLPTVIAQGGHPLVGAGPIIAAIDGSVADVAVLGWAADLAASAGTAVRPALAVSSMGESYPHPPGATRAERKLEEVQETVSFVGAMDERIPDGLEVSVVYGEPADALLELATELGAALVVTGRGRGPLLDKVPAALIDDGSMSIAVVPATLPASWHEAHGGSLPGEHVSGSRWKAVAGWVEEVVGWAAADRRAEAHGELKRLAAAEPESARPHLTRDEEEELLDEAELRVRRDHGDLARGSAAEAGPRRIPPEAG